jgi:hypothetical protein
MRLLGSAMLAAALLTAAWGAVAFRPAAWTLRELFAAVLAVDGLRAGDD